MKLNEYKNQLLTEGLNESQAEAVITADGPLLVIAGPGSGKTKTLVERIIFLIRFKKVAPESIMVATFTEKAAKELITRVSNRLLELDIKVNLNEMYIGTLHSIFLRFVQDNKEFTRLKKNFRFLDQFDQKFLIFRNLKEFDLVENIELLYGEKTYGAWAKADNLIKAINKVSEENLSLDKLKNANEPIVSALGHCYEKYLEIIREENCLDFSAIQVEALELLTNQKEVLKKLQERIKFIMVDEYQDTNTIQELILLKLSNEQSNICVVGDDDQGLYRFRGATIRNILEFQNNFKKGICKKIELVTNYRSHPGIIDFYNKWMEEIEWTEGKKLFRYPKVIAPPEGKEFPDSASVVKVSSDKSFEDFCKEVLKFIKTLEKDKVLKNRNQIAFLFRSVKSEQALNLAHFLEENDVRVFSPRSALFFEREEIKLVLGCLIFVFPNLFDWLKWNPNANLEIWTYYEECKLFFANKLREDKAANKELILWCNATAQEHIEITKNKDYAFTALFYRLFQFPLFAQYLSVDLNSSVHDQRPTFNLAQFSQILAKFEFLMNVSVFTKDNHKRIVANFFNQFLRFLVDGGLEEYEDFDEISPDNCVSFLTIHQSKGLEFPIVFTCSLNQVPRKQFNDLDEILQNNYYHKKPFEPIEKTKSFDFQRLYYTAFSRPQNILCLAAFEKEGAGSTPSKYFRNIYKNIPSWKSKEFDYKKIKLEDVKGVNIKKEYAFTSHISLYENCPLQYKFYKALEFSPVRNAATMFGVLIHQTIEDIHKAVLTKKANTVTNENIQAWFDANYSSLVKTLKSYLAEGQKTAAMNQIIAYKERQEKDWSVIKHSELDVSLVKEDYILSGKIDLIRGENGTVEIVDFKGEKKPDINDPKIIERLKKYERQLQVYAHLVEERYNEKVSKMHLYYTGAKDENPYVSFDYDKTKITSTIKEFDKVVEKIEAKNFDVSKVEKNEKQCGNCDLRHYCNPRYPLF